MNDWRDEVATEIIAAPVRAPAYTSPREQDLLRVYAWSPAKAGALYAQALQQYQNRIKLVTQITIGGIGLILIGLLLHNVEWAAVPLSFAGIIMLFWVSAEWVFMEKPKDYQNIDTILQRDSHFYLPAVQYEENGATLKVSLSDKHTTYAVRTFAVGEETAALEYQVELEAIVTSVSGDRAQQYAKARTATLQPPSDRPAAVVSAATPDIVEMKALLTSQRQPTVITAGDDDLLSSADEQLIQ